jgi:CHRD domain-containing protein
MKKMRFLKVLLILTIIVGTHVLVVRPGSPRNFRTHLSGGNEVPARDSQGQGEAIFQLNADGTELSYKLISANITNIFMAHIHLAPEGVNGPIVVWLYPSAPPAQSIPGRFDGVLAEGIITSSNFMGPLAGQPLSALMDALESGNAYVNVHTNDFVDPPNTGPGDFPGGEIRGQVQ